MPEPSAPRDWLVALDDLLTQRMRHCGLCGAMCGAQIYVGIWDLTSRRSVAYILCLTCQRQPDWEATLRDRLAARYGHHTQDRKEASA